MQLGLKFQALLNFTMNLVIKALPKPDEQRFVPTVNIPSISNAEGFMLPDGSYAMSQKQAAEVMGLSERNARDFLQSKALKSLMGKGYTPAISEIEPEGQMRGSSRVRALPLEVVAVYWQWQSHRGNKQAFALCTAFTLEGLLRRFDAAFERDRSEGDYLAELSVMQVLLESQDEELATTLAMVDERSEWVRRLEDQVRELGGEPWQLPKDEEGEANF